MSGTAVLKESISGWKHVPVQLAADMQQPYAGPGSAALQSHGLGWSSSAQTVHQEHRNGAQDRAFFSLAGCLEAH